MTIGASRSATPTPTGIPPLTRASRRRKRPFLPSQHRRAARPACPPPAARTAPAAPPRLGPHSAPLASPPPPPPQGPPQGSAGNVSEAAAIAGRGPRRVHGTERSPSSRPLLSPPPTPPCAGEAANAAEAYRLLRRRRRRGRDRARRVPHSGRRCQASAALRQARLTPSPPPSRLRLLYQEGQGNSIPPSPRAGPRGSGEAAAVRGGGAGGPRLGEGGAWRR